MKLTKKKEWKECYGAMGEVRGVGEGGKMKIQYVCFCIFSGLEAENEKATSKCIIDSRV